MGSSEEEPDFRFGRYENKRIRLSGRSGEKVVDLNTVLTNLRKDKNYLNKMLRIRLNQD
jgi:hypothetical protein